MEKQPSNEKETVEGPGAKTSSTGPVDRLNRFGDRYKGAIAVGSLCFALILILLNVIRIINLPPLLATTLLVLGFYTMMKLLGLGSRLLAARIRPTFPRGEIFAGVFSGNSEPVTHLGMMIDRSPELEELKKRIFEENEKQQVLAITGISGVGKSTLVNLLVAELAQNEATRVIVKHVSFNDPRQTYDQSLRGIHAFIEAEADTLKQWDTRNENKYALIILDQFEACLDYIYDVYLSRQKVKKSLREFLADADTHTDPTIKTLGKLLLLQREHPHLRVAVVVRSDRYYDLRFLGEYGQIPYDAFEVLGIGQGSGENRMIESLKAIGIDPKDVQALLATLKEEDGTVLPVRLQIVGCMLELQQLYPQYSQIRRLISGQPRRQEVPRGCFTLEDYKEAGGAAGLTEGYFRAAIDSSPSPQVAREILYVTGIEGRVWTRYTVSDFADIIYRGEEQIRETISFLESKGLLLSDSRGRYAFHHDFLAQQYNDLSGRLIEPVIRDNLAYSHTILKAHKKPSHEQTKAQVAHHNSAWWFLEVVKCTVLFLLALRIWHFGLFPTALPFAWLRRVFSDYSMHPGWALDWQYLPIAVAHGTWGFYVIGLVQNIFSHIDHNFRMKIFSWLPVCCVLAGIILTEIIPGLWVTSISINALMVSLKFSILGREVHKSTGGRVRFGLIGVYTLVNGLIALVLGTKYWKIAWDGKGALEDGFGAIFWDLASLSPERGFLTVYYGLILSLVYFVYMYGHHVRPNAAVEFIGWYNRIGAAGQ